MHVFCVFHDPAILYSFLFLFLLNKDVSIVTFSDGEPLLHHEFLDQVLQRCRKEKMYTAIGLYEINLLRFHRMGATKWEQRGKKYEYSDHGDMPEERMLELQERYLNNDIACYIGEDTPF